MTYSFDRFNNIYRWLLCFQSNIALYVLKVHRFFLQILHACNIAVFSFFLHIVHLKFFFLCEYHTGSNSLAICIYHTMRYSVRVAMSRSAFTHYHKISDNQHSYCLLLDSFILIFLFFVFWSIQFFFVAWIIYRILQVSIIFVRKILVYIVLVNLSSTVVSITHGSVL